MKNIKGLWKVFIIGFSFLLVIFQLFTSGFGVLPDILQRSVHLFFVLAMVFIVKPVKKGMPRERVPFYDVILAALSLITTGYMIMIYNQILWDPLKWVSDFDKAFAIILVALVLEASRRSVGWTFPVMAIFFLIYAYFGEYFPGRWGHKQFSINYIFQSLYHTTNGIWGTLVGLSATMLAMFGIFGAVLSETGGSQTFIKLGEKMTGKTIGGPGKVSLIASGLFGMISGSAMANVVATGTFTIPMMKKFKYNNEWSAAISAVGSTGGQIMPPMMGAGAFIMAQLIGISYLSIAKAAIIPAFLYYLGAYVAIHYLSKKMNIIGNKNKVFISLTELLVVIIPLAVFLFFLLNRYTVTTAAFYSTVIAIITTVSCYFANNKSIHQTTKNTGSLLYKVTISGAESILSMAALLAGAQISIALIAMTGFGVNMSELIVSIGEDNLFLCLLLSTLVCIILGMGLPTTAAYVLSAAILAPALIMLGIKPLVAHLFVFYFSTLATITPPVCAAVFLSSGIAESNWLKTGLLSCLIAIPAFVVPYTFAYNEALILSGSISGILLGVITAVIGVYFIGMAIAGYIRENIIMPLRIAMFIGGVVLLIPNFIWSMIGLAVCIICFIISSFIIKSAKAA